MDLYYKSGAIYLRGSENKKEYFYEDGALKTVESYSDGKLDGEVFLYWSNGTMKRNCYFQKGVRHGLDRIWNDKEILVDESFYEMGLPVGIHRRFSQEGKLIELIEYIEHPRFNISGWDEHGNIRLETLWKGSDYSEKAWDRFQNVWVEKKGFWNGKQLVYL